MHLRWGFNRTLTLISYVDLNDEERYCVAFEEHKVDLCVALILIHCQADVEG